MYPTWKVYKRCCDRKDVDFTLSVIKSVNPHSVILERGKVSTKDLANIANAGFTILRMVATQSPVRYLLKEYHIGTHGWKTIQVFKSKEKLEYRLEQLLLDRSTILMC
jgi:hypothetical protein